MMGKLCIQAWDTFKIHTHIMVASQQINIDPQVNSSISILALPTLIDTKKLT